MFTHNGLNHLEATFRAQLPDDTGTTQLALLLIAELRKSRQNLVQAAIPLEVLAGQIRCKAYTELSPDFQESIVKAVDLIRIALESHNCEHAKEDHDEHLIAHCDVDQDVFSDENHREYFDCLCGGDEHVFKFTLDPTDGEFWLSTHLHQYRNFFQRLWVGLKYIFGYRSKYGHWDVVELDLRSVERLHRLTNEALDAMQKQASNNIRKC